LYRSSTADELPRIQALIVRSINDLTERHGFGSTAGLRPPDFQLSLGRTIKEDFGRPNRTARLSAQRSAGRAESFGFWPNCLFPRRFKARASVTNCCDALSITPKKPVPGQGR
jgi:hypothetical protein